jgi:hypothetical protein
MNFPLKASCRVQCRLNPGYRRHQAFAVSLRERVPGQKRSPGSRRNQRLESNAPQNIRSREGAALGRAMMP